MTSQNGRFSCTTKGGGFSTGTCPGPLHVAKWPTAVHAAATRCWIGRQARRGGTSASSLSIATIKYRAGCAAPAASACSANASRCWTARNAASPFSRRLPARTSTQCFPTRICFQSASRRRHTGSWRCTTARRESCVVAVYDEALQTVFQIQCSGEFEHWGTTNGMVLRERDVIVCLSSEKEWLHVFAD